MLLSLSARQYRQPVNFFDSAIRDGNAANRDTVAVQEDVATQILFRSQDAVGGVRIADVQAQIEIALRVKPIQLVKTFRDLFVAKAAFWTPNT